MMIRNTTLVRLYFQAYGLTTWNPLLLTFRNCCNNRRERRRIFFEELLVKVKQLPEFDLNSYEKLLTDLKDSGYSFHMVSCPKNKLWTSDTSQ